MKFKRSIYNVFFSIFSLVITFSIGIIIPKLFIVNLGSEANGLVASVGQVFAYVGLLEAGIGTTVTQALYKPISEKDVSGINSILSASNRYYKKIGFIYIGCIVLVAVIYPLVVKTNIPIWQVVGVVCFSGLGNAINFLLQQNYVVLLSADGKGYVTTNINLVVNVLISILKVVLLLLGFNLFFVILGQFLVSLFRIVIMRIYIKHSYSWVNFGAVPNKAALGKQKYVMIQQLSYFVFSNTDIVVLTFLTDLTVVSVYAVYNMIIGVIESIVSSFTNGVLFALGQLYNENFQKFKKVYKVYDSCYMTLVFILFSIVYVCIIPFLSIYTKGIKDVNYLDSFLAFLFVVLKMVTTLRSQSQNVINIAGHFKETQKSSIVEASLNIAISVVGACFWGIYGVLFGSIVSSLFKGIAVTNYTNKYIIYATKKEKAVKYLRWVAYIIVFIIITVINHLFFQISFDNYLSWILFAIPCGFVSVLIYTVLWAVLDLETTKNTVLFLKKKIKRGHK